MIGELAMKWIINMRVKDYIRNWSNQEIITEYAGVMVNIKIKGLFIRMCGIENRLKAA